MPDYPEFNIRPSQRFSVYYIDNILKEEHMFVAKNLPGVVRGIMSVLRNYSGRIYITSKKLPNETEFSPLESVLLLQIYNLCGKNTSLDVHLTPTNV